MWKQLMVLFGILLLGLTFGCGEKYSDAIDVHEDFIDLASRYVADMDTADSAEKVAAAMNTYAEGIEAIAPRIRKINEKYPELKDPDSVPEKLKQTSKEQTALMQKVGSSFMKAMPYMRNPEVKNAQERISKAMQGMAGR